jgi:hypothetical protein
LEVTKQQVKDVLEFPSGFSFSEFSFSKIVNWGTMDGTKWDVLHSRVFSVFPTLGPDQENNFKKLIIKIQRKIFQKKIYPKLNSIGF